VQFKWDYKPDVLPRYRFGFSTTYFHLTAATFALVGVLALFEDGHRAYCLLFWLISLCFLWAARNNRRI
jgi:hypothetical protein